MIEKEKTYKGFKLNIAGIEISKTTVDNHLKMEEIRKKYPMYHPNCLIPSCSDIAMHEHKTGKNVFV